MEENNTTTENVVPEAQPSTPVTPAASSAVPAGQRRVSFPRRTPGGPGAARGGPGGPRSGPGGGSRGPGGPGGSRGGPGGGRGNDRRGPRPPAAKPEYDQKTILVRRVTRVVAGGRRFSFSVAIVIGNHAGSVGVGVGKAGDTGLAIQKAFNAAKKAMIRVPMTKTNSIPHEVAAKTSSARLSVRPNFGKGLVAGSSVRTVFELAGITDITAKVLSKSRNKLNNARAAVSALSKLRS